jgi:hypothetical protein
VDVLVVVLVTLTVFKSWQTAWSLNARLTLQSCPLTALTVLSAMVLPVVSFTATLPTPSPVKSKGAAQPDIKKRKDTASILDMVN